MKNVTQIQIGLPQSFTGVIILRVPSVTKTELLTRNQLAQQFKVDPSTISKWKKAGKIQAVRSGRGSIYSRQEVLQRIIIIQL